MAKLKRSTRLLLAGRASLEPRFGKDRPIARKKIARQIRQSRKKFGEADVRKRRIEASKEDLPGAIRVAAKKKKILGRKPSRKKVFKGL